MQGPTLTQPLTRQAIIEFAAEPDLALLNVKVKRTVSAAHHFIAVASLASRIVEALCDMGRCPRKSKAEAVAEAFLLGLAHDYAKLHGSKELASALSRIMEKIVEATSGVTGLAPQAPILKAIIENPDSYASLAESGVALGPRHIPPRAVVNAVILADLLASIDSLTELIARYPQLFTTREAQVAASDTYINAVEYLKGLGILFSYIRVDPHAPHKILLAKASRKIVEGVGGIPLAIYPDGLVILLTQPIDKKPGEWLVDSIVEVVTEKPDKSRVSSILNRYYEETLLKITRMIAATLLLARGEKPETVVSNLYSDIDEARKEKALKALAELAKCLKGSQCKSSIDSLDSLAGFKISHGKRYLEAYPDVFADPKISESLIKTKYLEAAKAVIDASPDVNLNPETLAVAALLFTYSKEAEKLKKLSEKLKVGFPETRRVKVEDKLLWAAQAALKNLPLDTVVSVILENPPTKKPMPAKISCKVALSISTPLAERPACTDTGDELYTCAICQLSGPREEFWSIREVKTQLQMGPFESLESWLNIFPPLKNVDHYVNPQRPTGPFMVCMLCAYEASHNLNPPRLVIRLGPPITYEMLRAFTSILSAGSLPGRGQVEETVDYFSGSIIVPLLAGRDPLTNIIITSLLSNGKEWVLYDGSDGSVVKAVLSKLSYAKALPLYLADPVYEAFLGGTPLLEVSNNGVSIAPEIPELEAVLAVKDLAPARIKAYKAVSRALRAWSKAVSTCMRARGAEKYPFPRITPRAERGGLVLDLLDRVEVVSPDGSKFVLPFSLAALGAHKAKACLGDNQGAAREASRAVSAALDLESLFMSLPLEVVGLVSSGLVGYIRWYSNRVRDLLDSRKGEEASRASSHEVIAFLRGLEDAVRNWSLRQGVEGAREEAVELAAAYANNRLIKVYRCNPAESKPCTEIVRAVRKIAEEVIKDLEAGRITLGEASRRIKDIGHLAYYFYVFSFLKSREASKS